MYVVDTSKMNGKTYFVLVSAETYDVDTLTGKYLVHMIDRNFSPKSVKDTAFILKYYMNYLESAGLAINDIYDMSYEVQYRHFIGFLNYIKSGKHRNELTVKVIKNSTCNAYLKRVFGLYVFLGKATRKHLKVLTSSKRSGTTTVGTRIYKDYYKFDGYFKQELSKGKSIRKDNIEKLIDGCANNRDRFLIMLLACGGFRIGELLGIRYTTDIDYKNGRIKVVYRETNKNGARAKYAEERSVPLSDECRAMLSVYISEYADVLKDQEYLFVRIDGLGKGLPLTSGAVYSIFRKLEIKTGVKASPHMIRHYFANERRKAGWDLSLISYALGHKKITTTEEYLNVEYEELEDAQNAYYKNKGIESIFKYIKE